MNAITVDPLVAAVQTNCHIADERHAGDLTLCIYLLQMREFYRWERGLAFGAPLARDAIGAWIAEREMLWGTLASQEFVPLPCGPDAPPLDAFDVDAVNARLRPRGWVYGAGLVGAERPVFFLAELHGLGQRGGVDVVTAGRELARGLLAPPAMLGSGERGPIVLRQASLARWLWEKFEAYTLRPVPGTAFHAVVQAYGLDQDFEAALPRCLEEQCETLVLHELGEHQAGGLLGPRWAAMRLALPTRRADLYARAVRDHLADLGLTLPTLLDRDAAAAIHFWFANFDGIRSLLFPTLPEAYAHWVRGDGGAALRRAAAGGVVHFTRLAQDALALHAKSEALAGQAIERLLTAPSAVCPGLDPA
ncbi:MAG: hypothetical protein IPF94_16090 [Betaproteobacteria bacterium]|nr:hypothetical protein [Betaproteobacteria bacterium]